MKNILHNHVDGDALEPLVEFQVRTESSVWLIRPDRYMRMPISEAPREPEDSIAGRLDDSHWHGHQGVFWSDVGWGPQLRIKPTAGPVGGGGIHTGVIQEIRGY